MSTGAAQNINRTKKLVIQSDPANIVQVEQFIELLKDELGFKDDVFGNVMVATTEAVNNGIIHGNKKDVEKKVYVTCDVLSTYRLKITVSDEGKGFDPNAVADPTSLENLENPGGRGVFIMQHLCDDLKFEQEGRTAEMIFNI